MTEEEKMMEVKISHPRCVRDLRHKCHMMDSWSSRDCIYCRYGESDAGKGC